LGVALGAGKENVGVGAIWVITRIHWRVVVVVAGVVMESKQPIHKSMEVVAIGMMLVLDHHRRHGLNSVSKDHAQHQNGVQKLAIESLD
jgi:hypothetical protein